MVPLRRSSKRGRSPARRASAAQMAWKTAQVQMNLCASTSLSCAGVRAAPADTRANSTIA